jgi:hypothetical protein
MAVRCCIRDTAALLAGYIRSRPPSSESLYRYPNQLNPDPLKAAPLGPFILGQGGKIILVP